MVLPAVKNVLYYALRVAHTFVNNITAIPAFIVWYVLLTPIRLFFPKAYWTLENVLFKAILSYVVSWTNTGGYKILESGDDLSALYDEQALVLVNHQSTADIPSVMSALYPKSLVLGKVMWIMDYIFIYTNFGWVSYLHRDFFIQQGKEGRVQQLQNLRAHLEKNYLTTSKRWIVLFPEGGFLYKRRQRSQAYAKKHNVPILEHCTLPRVGAIQTILDTVGEGQTRNGLRTEADGRQGPDKKDGKLRWVIDLTLAYPKGEPMDMHGICIGWWKPCHIMVHYRAYPISDIPLDMEERTKWFYDRYVEKEKMLDGYYKENKFLDESDDQERRLPRFQRQEATPDKLGIIIAYVFYTLSAYLFWLYFYCPVWRLFMSFVSLVW